MFSRSWYSQRNGVNAPMSTDVVPSHTTCDMMRESSMRSRGAPWRAACISMPNSRSAASENATLFPGEFR